MDITLEQARAYEAVARLGTVQKAAAELHRGHSAVLYSLKNLEEQTHLNLFDRSGHRNLITLEGEIVLKYCRRLLETKRELIETCNKMSTGWEPSLKLIYDEVVDFNLIGSALFELNELQPPTEVKVLSAHLSEVENLFETERAEIMVTVLPFQRLQLPSHRLPPIRMYLVAHQHHGLNQKNRGRLTSEDLNHHTFISIKTNLGSAGLSTEQLRFNSNFYVNGFTTKKLAIFNKLGFGWLPDYLILAELRKGTLRVLKTEIENTITLHPKLYHRAEEQMGLASQKLLQAIRTK